MRVFDIESDGLLDTVSKIHCINVIDRATGARKAFNVGVYKDGTPAPRDGDIEAGVRFLEEADCIAGTNIINYDLPAIKKLYPWFKPRGRIVDTLPLTRVIYPEVKNRDHERILKGKLPHEFQKRGLIGKHSVEAWGMRLGLMKEDFDPADYKDENGEPCTWANIGFTKEMDHYGRRDPEVSLKILEWVEKKNYAAECFELETEVAQIIFRQHERGWCFSMKAAEELTQKLQVRHAEITSDLMQRFQPWYAPKIEKGSALKTVKKTRREWIADPLGPVTRAFKDKVSGEKYTQRGHYRYYDAGVQFTQVKHVVFNPASREHIADRLMKLRGWKPREFTDNGEPKIDETVLEALPWPEARVLSEYLLVEKRLGQVATGKQAWMKKAVRTGIYGIEGEHYRIHGTVNTNGAVTGRMTHAHPNVAQCPKADKHVPYGYECRSCWIATPGMVLVGCDAEGLELRMLGHYMAKYDDGAYALAVVEGKKENGTDVHTINQKAAGLNTRDNAKTFIYALLYGAGAYKLGMIAYDDLTDEQRAKFNAKYPSKRQKAGALKRLGERKKARLMGNLPALGKLVERVKEIARERGELRGLDGRILHVRSEHAALNTLLQSAGAVVMKKALVLLDRAIGASEVFQMGDVFFVGNIHDEFQMETSSDKAETLGSLAADSIRLAGEHFKLRCPLAGSHGVGTSWAGTH